MLILLLNVMNSVVKLLKNTILGSIAKVDNAESVQTYTHYNSIVSRIMSRPRPQNPYFQYFPDCSASQTHAHNINKSPMQLQDANVPSEIQHKLHTMLTSKFSGIISKSPADFGSTNLIEMDLPTTGSPVSTKPYTIHLKYKSFVDDEIKLWKMPAVFPSHLVIGHCHMHHEEEARSKSMKRNPTPHVC